jgi:hypothetical protein
MSYNPFSGEKNFAGYYPQKSFAFIDRAVILNFRKELHFAITRKMEPKRNFAKGRG